MARDIFKLDNYFITIGTLFLLIGGLSILGDPRTYYEITIMSDNRLEFENWDGRTEDQIREEYGKDTRILVSEFPTIRVIIAANGLILLVVGMSYRSTERKIISVWDALDRAGEARVNDLAVSLGVTRDFVLKHLKHINAQPNTYYVYDSEKDKIADGKLMAEYAFSAPCPACGHSISQQIRLNYSSPPKCSYCGSSASMDDLNKLKHDILSNRYQPSFTLPNSGFRVGIFVLLLIFFWPGAFVYLFIKKSNAFNSMLGQAAQ